MLPRPSPAAAPTQDRRRPPHWPQHRQDPPCQPRRNRRDRPCGRARPAESPADPDPYEWAVAERRYLSEESMANIGQPIVTVEDTPFAITA